MNKAANETSKSIQVLNELYTIARTMLDGKGRFAVIVKLNELHDEICTDENLQPNCSRCAEFINDPEREE